MALIFGKEPGSCVLSFSTKQVLAKHGVKNFFNPTNSSQKKKNCSEEMFIKSKIFCMITLKNDIFKFKITNKPIFQSITLSLQHRNYLSNKINKI